MTIEEGAIKVSEFLATENGWKQLDQAWLNASLNSYAKVYGPAIISCALDYRTERFLVGGRGDWHAKARYDFLRKLMDDDVIQHFRRYHDQTPVEGQGVGGGTASPSGALVADGNLFGMQVKCCRQ